MISEICLVSASPRRSELLHQVGIPHRVAPVSVDESRREGESPEGYVERLARDKALAGERSLGGHSGGPWLAADTAVVVEGRVLGKPAGRDEGLAMLRLLSGRSHQVFTGVALYANGRLRSCASRSEVRFRSIEEWELAAYWDTGEPCDKAGGYAIQGIAAGFVSHLSGSYSGVMGLPLFETARLLACAGFPLLQSRCQERIE